MTWTIARTALLVRRDPSGGEPGPKWEHNTVCTPLTLSWRELEALLTTPSVRSVEPQFAALGLDPKRTLPAWMPVVLREDELGRHMRNDGNVEVVSALVMDLDAGEPLERCRELAAGRLAICHTSWSHTLAHPKARLVFPLAEPAPGDMWPQVWAAGSRWAAAHGLTIDPQTKSRSHLYFLPAVPDEPQRQRDFAAWSLAGPPLRWPSLLADWPARESVPPPTGHGTPPLGPAEPPARRLIDPNDWARPRFDRDAHKRTFAQRVVNARADEIAGTKEGDRNRRVYRAATALTQLHLAGALPGLDAALASITTAAGTAGLGQSEIASTIASGVRAGTTNGPWQFEPLTGGDRG
ncbi:hypothetical protein LBMAG42_56180 [Deltaproteobacteria bacterium]|nr:hypothetical protein LBMAG42_56180 [Deltaproteobacteria bacterium]